MDNSRYLYYPAGTVPVRKTMPTSSPLTMGGFGMIVGAAGSAAANIRRLNDGDIDKGQAALNVARDAAGAGVATAVATGIVNVLGLTGLLSVAGLLTTATATKYIYNSAFEPKKEPAAPEPAPKPSAKKTAATKKAVKKTAAAKKTAKKSTKTTAKKEE